MRHIYNCEQISIPRAVSYNNMSDSPSQHIVLTSDSQQSSFDDTIPSPTVKGKSDFSTKARFVHVVRDSHRCCRLPSCPVIYLC